VYRCAYTTQVTFQWDSEKASANRKKHRADFADAIAVLEDPYALTKDDPHPREQRFVTLGVDALGCLLVVSWTQRGQDFRIISARPATRAESRAYPDEE
jgi:uncharacterized DUF497 family protein